LVKRLAASFVAAGALFAAGGGCGPDPSRYDEVERWQCFEDASSCDCFGTPDDRTLEDPRSKVVSCRAPLACCFVQTRTDGTYECRCLAAPLRTGGAGGEGGGDASSGGGGLDCHAAAIDAGSTEVVPRCPPVSLNDSAVCALAFESCEPDYLAENGLIACCEGTRCRQNQYGVEVCQPD
jgi:hypothetical protein